MIQLTGELYDELITMRILGINRSKTPWVILFANTKNIDSKRAMTSYKELAKHYNGTVNFGWVDHISEELLSESFGVT